MKKTGSYGSFLPNLPQDLAGVQKLQKRLALLEADVLVHQEQIDSLSSQAQQFIKAGHFDSEAISERQQALEGRYQGLKVGRQCGFTGGPATLVWVPISG